MLLGYDKPHLPARGYTRLNDLSGVTKIYHSLVLKRKRKSALLFFSPRFTILKEQREMNLLKDVCIHESVVKQPRAEYETQRDGNLKLRPHIGLIMVINRQLLISG